MKKYDIVKLKDNYENFNNIEANNIGIVLKSNNNDKSTILFLNPKITGDYLVLDVDNSFLEQQKENLPPQIIETIDSLISNNKISLKKQQFKNMKFEEYDIVRLTVEKEKYTKHGIHKGETGIVAENYMIKNDILVDFSGIDEKGNYYGDCVTVNVDDLELVKKHD